MIVDQRLRNLLVRYRGKVLFDFSGPKDVCSIHARRDGARDDDWIYVAFDYTRESYDHSVRHMENLLLMPQAEFDRKYPKDSD